MLAQKRKTHGASLLDKGYRQLRNAKIRRNNFSYREYPNMLSNKKLSSLKSYKYKFLCFLCIHASMLYIYDNTYRYIICNMIYVHNSNQIPKQILNVSNCDG